MYTKDKAVIMTGTFVDSYEPGKLNRMGRWYKPWFYKHVEKFLKTGRRVEYVPTVDFLFRSVIRIWSIIIILLPGIQFTLA